MSLAGEIMVRLGLDTKGFSSGMNQAAQEAQRGGAAMERGLNRATAAHGNLLKSNARVAHQISNFSREMVSGADASQIFATGLEGLGRSLKLSLGALSGIFVGAVVVGNIYKAVEAAQKLRKEIADLGEDAGSGKFATLDALIARLDKIKVKSQELADQHQKNVDALASSGPVTARAVSAENSDYERLKRIADESGHATQREIAEKRRRKLAAKDDKFAKFDRHNSDEYMEAATPGSPKENQLLAEVIAKDLADGLKDLIKTIMEKASEKTKLTLSQLSEGPGFGDQNKSSLKAIYESEQARKAVALDKQGDELMKNQGDYAGAYALHGQAEQIRNGISGLKDSEKTTEFKDALDASVRLKAIEDKLSFKNQ